MNQPVILYALERRQNGAKNVFLTKSDVEGIIRIKQGDEQAPSGRRRRGAGGGAAVQGGAKNYSKKVLQFFQVLKGAGGQDILCRCVKRSGEWRWCPVVPLEELPRVIKEHHERATGFSGVEKLYTHVSDTRGAMMPPDQLESALHQAATGCIAASTGGAARPRWRCPPLHLSLLPSLTPRTPLVLLCCSAAFPAAGLQRTHRAGSWCRRQGALPLRPGGV